MAELEKAFLEIEGGQRHPVPVQPGPAADRTLEQLVRRHAARTRRAHPALRRRKLRTLSLDLFFDTTDDRHGGHPPHRQDPAAHGRRPVAAGLGRAASNNVRPPYVIFHWGDLHSFKAVVSNLRADLHLLLVHRDPAARIDGAEADAVRGVPGVRAAEPDVGHPQPAPRPPGAARRDARPHRGALLRRRHPRGVTLATANAIDRSAGAQGWILAVDPPAGRMTAAATGPALNLTAPEVLIAGRALSAAWLTYLKDIRVERGVRTIGRAVIQFWDPDRELSESSQCRIGDEVSIVSANGKKYFVGTISRRTVSTENLDTTFSITVRDRAAELVGGTMATAHAQLDPQRRAARSGAQHHVEPAGHRRRRARCRASAHQAAACPWSTRSPVGAASTGRSTAPP